MIAMASRVQVAAAAPRDAEGMAACHLRCFPDQFMTHMGGAYTAAFYRAYISGGLAFVCRDEDDRVVGIVVGGNPGIRAAFLERVRGSFVGTLLWRTVIDREVRRTLVDEVVRRLHGRPGRRAEADAAWPGSVTGDLGLLQVIAVLEDHRGNGCASALLRAFEGSTAAAGYGTLGLTVHPDNHRAIAFYLKNGWRRVHEDGGALYMQRVVRAHTGRRPRPLPVRVPHVTRERLFTPRSAGGPNRRPAEAGLELSSRRRSGEAVRG